MSDIRSTVNTLMVYAPCLDQVDDEDAYRLSSTIQKLEALTGHLKRMRKTRRAEEAFKIGKSDFEKAQVEPIHA